MFQELHIQENNTPCHQEALSAWLAPSPPGQGLEHRQLEMSATPSRILFSSSLPLNFQLQQSLPFLMGCLWAHLPSQIH